MIRQAIRGEVNLGVTFWGLGGLGTLVVLLLLFLLGQLLPFGLWNLIMLGVLLAAWGIIVVVAVWRSSRRYRGPLLWKWLARTVVLLSYGGGLLFGGMAWYIVRPDFTTTSLNVQEQLQYDPAYPYIGFWKTDCSESFGLVVEKADEGRYFMRFCGPGGCFGKGPLTRVKLGEESIVRIIDGATLGVPASRFPLEELDQAERAEMQTKIKDGMLLFKKCR